MSYLTRARTVPLSLLPDCPLQWPDKYQSDILDYALDPTLWLKDGGDTLTTMSVIIPPESGLVLLWWSLINGKAALALAGGNPGATLINVILTTNAGRRYVAVVTLTIQADTPLIPAPTPPLLPGGYCIPPTSLSDQSAILTLPNGAPLTM
ncbi:hypothetical protein GS501_00640 [Saccharibacter sp. 17.LH.SD]|uniref:phage fiber-tail adaptor protein n=1 Tax=Saccharibacter sp. 17.LH.SD TaxID=2689393 RepID=UPI00136BF442|nr:hypothetical protein [Saccharibacter sp. 17.LH.SD]MXV43586.1 hypothetical protein [Saccharibacter sp. 17.LH.SD]